MTSNDDKNDSELNRYLQGDSELSRHYAEKRNQLPPEKLDRKILDAAGSHIASKRHTSRRFHRASWALPLSFAAIITLSVTLVLNMPSYSRYPVVDDADDYLPEPATIAEQKQPPEPEPRPADSPAKLRQQDAAPAMIKRETTRESLPGTEEQNISRDVQEESFQSIEVERSADMLQKRFESSAELLEQPASAGAVSPQIKQQAFTDKSLLEEIKSLLEAGDKQEAHELWQLFQESYPEFPEDKVRQILGEHHYSVLQLSDSE